VASGEKKKEERRKKKDKTNAETQRVLAEKEEKT